MPQIANQDYNIVKATPGIANIGVDAHSLGELKRYFLQGTIFDVIIDVDGELRRVMATDGGDFHIAESGGSSSISVENYSVEQYEGLAAIQQAALAQGETITMIPRLYFGLIEGVDEIGVSLDDSAGIAYPIVDEEGNVYSASIESETITAVQKTQRAPQYVWEGSPLVVPFEEVQKLVGLTVTEY